MSTFICRIGLRGKQSWAGHSGVCWGWGGVGWGGCGGDGEESFYQTNLFKILPSGETQTKWENTRTYYTIYLHFIQSLHIYMFRACYLPIIRM
jgi:hypothetical protein